jgi:putative DNA primase/helicase
VIPDNEVDRDMPKTLQAEWPGILAWAVRGCLAWQLDGLRTPDVVLAATSSYRKRADHLRRFIRECVIQEEHAETASSLVYTAYTDWCSANHERPVSTAKFKKDLEDQGFEHDRVQSGSLWRHTRLRR